MSRRNKLQKFAELLTFENVYENKNAEKPQLTHGNIPIDLKGKWNTLHFKNEQPITLELACGRGEYTLSLAQQYPERNFIGVDIKGARLWKGATIAREQNLHNAAFLRTRIEQITHFFAPEEVDEIWITFPDPFLRKGKANRRLTSPYFLNTYRKILKKGAIIHLKTDEPNLYEYSLETLHVDHQSTILYQDNDIYTKPLPIAELNTHTYYEKLHLEAGKKIKYIQFKVS